MESKKSSSLLKSTLIMSTATFLSRILGLVREQAIAFYFGASGATDTFNVAYRIPNLLRDLLAEGAFSSAFVPTFTESLKRNRDEAAELFRTCFWFLLLLTSFITIFFIIFAPSIILLFAPEYQLDPHKFELTVGLLRIMSPFLTLVSLAAILMGVLNTARIFFVPALAPAIFNVASILFIFFLTPYLESRGSDGIYALAWGVLAGGFVQLMIQVPLLKKMGFTFARPSSFFSPALKKILKRLIPGLVGVAAAQINILINTILATSSIVGSVSWLNYAFRLFSFPLGILSVALGSSTLVHFSDAWKSNQRAKALDILQRSTFYSWALVAIPFIFLAIFSDWLVVLVYERGLFQVNDSLQTTKALFWYGLGLPFYGLLKVLVPIFYTIDRAKIPMYTALVSLSVNVIYSLIFIGDLGHVALAQATTLSVTTNGLLLLFFLNKYLNLPWNFFLSKNLNCIIFSTAICLIPAWLMHQHIPFFAFHNMIQLVVLGLIAIIFLLLFETLLYFFGVGPIFINRIKFLKF